MTGQCPPLKWGSNPHPDSTHNYTWSCSSGVERRFYKANVLRSKRSRTTIKSSIWAYPGDYKVNVTSKFNPWVDCYCGNRYDDGWDQCRASTRRDCERELKPSVRCKRSVAPIVCGQSAFVYPIDHPNTEKVSNKGLVQTSTVVEVTRNKAGHLTGFETLNTKYVLEP